MKLVVNDASFLQVYIDTLHVGMKIVHCGYIDIYIGSLQVDFRVEQCSIR